MLGNRGATASHRARLLGQHSRDDRLRCAPRVRRITSQHLISHCAERIDVAPPVDDAITRCLLRTHVLRSAERESRLRDAIAARFAHRESDSEIGDYRLTRLKKNVLRLEIAMDYAMRVRVVECIRNRDGDSYRFVDRQLFLALESCA